MVGIDLLTVITVGTGSRTETGDMIEALNTVAQEIEVTRVIETRVRIRTETVRALETDPGIDTGDKFTNIQAKTVLLTMKHVKMG